MKSFAEWRKENVNEIFGLFGKPKPKAQGPAPVVAPKKAWCPFCNAWSAVEEDAYYPKGLMVWQCQKCRREWDSETVAAREREDYADRGAFALKHSISSTRRDADAAPVPPGGIFLHKDDVKTS